MARYTKLQLFILLKFNQSTLSSHVSLFMRVKMWTRNIYYSVHLFEVYLKRFVTAHEQKISRFNSERGHKLQTNGDHKTW